MDRVSRAARRLCLTLLWLPLLVGPTAAIVVGSDPRPPATWSSELRSTLAVSGIALRPGSGAGEPTATIWPRTTTLAAREPPPGSQPLAVPGVPVGAFLGVLELREPWSDFRGQVVAAATYGLHYAIQPVRKEHFGVSSHRDFLLLVPLDPTRQPPDELTEPTLLERSRHVNGRHPVVLALAPPTSQVDAPAQMVTVAGQQILEATFGGLRLGLVLVGRGVEHDL